MKKFKGSVLLLVIGGIFAGFINGLLGAGGGIIIVFVLSKLIKEADSRDVFANALCIMLPISVLSCILYTINGATSFEGFAPFIIPAILGGLIGGFLLCRTNTKFLKRLFALLVAVSGILLIFR